ncbi:YqjF family protein [Streptacidiphilus monticola]|uniref:YqjF family protein n=1 Tax=Streptacidiphilus monticola TaxID=2161674 RepID=A0ABW1FWF5_9ACTN
MVSVVCEQAVRFPALCGGWLCQPFVHWRYPPDQVQALLPAGLRVDTWDGVAWVGLTPLLMTDIRPLGLPSLPLTRRWCTFPETNLRTYVRGPDGRQGLWFLSIDVSSAVTAAATRALSGAPYHLADLSVTGDGTRWSYAGTRRGGRPGYRLRIRVGRPVSPTGREAWLTSRWRAYTRHLTGLLVTPVQHEPWPLAEAVIEELAEDLTEAAGLPAPADDPIAHFSPGVHRVRLGRPALPAAVGAVGATADTTRQTR